MRGHVSALLLAALFMGRSLAAPPRTTDRLPEGPTFVNGIGMRFVRVEPGTFPMGESATPIPDDLTEPLTYYSRAKMWNRFPFGDPSRLKLWIDHARFGDFDERPVRQVRISRPLFVGVLEVTNAEYELFDPTHRRLRGKNGFSKEDGEAAIFVSWHEAKAFCDWLSRKEGLPYRLPTEAEWEYACRAGTTTLYATGGTLSHEFQKNPRSTGFDQPKDIVPLAVGKTPANPWGLFDMHGNVEEWCWDWYGPYDPADRTDPVGRADGDFKVTRGGSHGTPLYFLRSANRLGLPPEAKTWLTGFRVVIGEIPSTKPLPGPGPQRFQQNVTQLPAPSSKVDPNKPYFKSPHVFVKVPKNSHGPLYSHHNHVPAITECPNGDLLAAWYTCVQERGRELAVAVSRLRRGAEEWEPASVFWDTPDRNDHAPILWFDGRDTIYHFNALGIAGSWSPLAIVMRTSKDNGTTWSKASFVTPEFGFRSMIVETVLRTREGAIVLASDVQPRYGDSGGRLSTIWVSRDEGKTWSDPEGNMAGQHPAIAQLKDGRLLALARAAPIDGWMPMSFSADMGKTWKSSASPFPPITGGQRPVLLRLKEGPILFASFARDVRRFEPNVGGQASRYLTNIFAAVSFDEGKTWPVRRVISDNRPDHAVFTMDEGRVRMSPSRSEPLGYLTVCQSQDGVVHLLSSINHYAFNLAWLKQGQPDVPLEPQPLSLPSRAKLLRVFTGSEMTEPANPSWHYELEKQEEGQPAGPEPSGLVNVYSKAGTLPRWFPYWSNDRTGEIGTLDPYKGATIEARVRVSQAAKGKCGFDLTSYVISGPRYLNRYSLTITSSGVYYRYDNALRTIAEGLDNSGSQHNYRMAIRPDTAVQIYRDGELLRTIDPDFHPDQSQAARGSYIAWGLGGAGIQAAVSHVAYDLSGAYQP